MALLISKHEKNITSTPPAQECSTEPLLFGTAQASPQASLLAHQRWTYRRFWDTTSKVRCIPPDSQMLDMQALQRPQNHRHEYSSCSQEYSMEPSLGQHKHCHKHPS
eukprot:1151654-Pelagomonas_calceolata.AAC.7